MTKPGFTTFIVILGMTLLTLNVIKGDGISPFVILLGDNSLKKKF